jgi:hypothetical protein
MIQWPVLKTGTTRRVIIFGPWAFKLARHANGAECNRFEAHLFRTTSERRRAMLAPVVWCSMSGYLLIARAAQAITEREAHELRKARGFPDWDYGGPSDVECPFEPKASDWGRIDGRPVAVDYANMDDL